MNNGDNTIDHWQAWSIEQKAAEQETVNPDFHLYI